MKMKGVFGILFGIVSLIILASFVSPTSVLVDLNTSRVSYGQELLWTANVTGSFDEQGTAIYSNDIVYVNSMRDNKTYALNATNGSLIWEYDVGTISGSSQGFGGPHEEGGIVYNAFNHVWAWNATTGVQIWNYTSLGGDIFSQNVAIWGDYLVAISYSSRIVLVLNKTDGTELWNTTLGVLGHGIAAEPLVWEDYLFVAVSNGDGLFAFNVTNGTELWNTSDNGFWDSSPILYGDQVVIGSQITPLIRSRYIVNGSNVWNATGTGGTTSTPSVHSDVFFIGQTGSIYATLRAYHANGTQKWEFLDDGANGGDQVYNQPAISGGLVFFNTECDSCAVDDGYMYAINETDGTLVWKYHVPEDIYGYTSIANGNAYVVTDYLLYAFDFGVGTGNWTLLGYDSNRTGYSPDGITSWQNVAVNCTENAVLNYTCNVTNNYDHSVPNINLSFETIGFSFDVYNSTNDLVNSSVNSYVFPTSFSAGESRTVTLVQEGGEVSSCMDITNPGEYTLTTDIINYGADFQCFDIQSDNVTFDCNGSLIDGGETTYYGAFLIDGTSGDWLENVTIRNCNINDFKHSFYMKYVRDSNFLNLNLSSANTAGVYIYSDVNNTLFENIRINTTGVGVHMDLGNVKFNNFSNMNIQGMTTYGIHFDNGGSDYNRIIDSVINASGTANIYFQGAIKGTEIYANNITGSAKGIDLGTSAGTDNNLVYDNFFNNTVNLVIGSSSQDNKWNTTFSSSTTNVIGDNAYGGNYWVYPNGTGFSETCNDSNNNGICDLAYDLESGSECTPGVNCTTGNIDYLPLYNLTNTAPTVDLSSLDSMNLDEDSSNLTINLSNYVSDNEDADSLINWSCSDNETYFAVSADNSTKLLNLTATNNFYGPVSVTCTAFDTFGSTDSGTFTVVVSNVADVSNVTLISPTTNSGNSNGNLTFLYNVSDSGVNIENCSLILDEVLNTTNTSITEDANQTFSLSNLPAGRYNWSVNCTNADSEEYASSTNYFSVFQFSGFTSNSTNVSNTNVSNITNFVIDNYPYGRINFSTNVDISNGSDLDSNVQINQNSIYLNSTNLTSLNTTARLTLYNLTFTNPRVLVDGDVCSDCTEVSYSGGIFIFDVIHFSNYTAEETPDASSNDESPSSSSSSVLKDKYLKISESEKTEKIYYWQKLHLEYKEKEYLLKVLTFNESVAIFTIDSKNFSLMEGETGYYNLSNASKIKITLSRYKNGIYTFSFSVIEKEIPGEVNKENFGGTVSGEIYNKITNNNQLKEVFNKKSLKFHDVWNSIIDFFRRLFGIKKI